MCEEYLLCVSKMLGDKVLNKIYIILALILETSGRGEQIIITQN